MGLLSSLFGNSTSTSAKEVPKEKYANQYIAVRTFFHRKTNSIEKVFNGSDVNAAFRNEQHNITKYVQEYTVFDDQQYIPTDPKHVAKLEESELKDITPKKVLGNIIHLGELFHKCETDVQLATANLIRDQIKRTGIKNNKTTLVLSMFDETKDFDFNAFKESQRLKQLSENSIEVYTMNNQTSPSNPLAVQNAII